MKMRKKDLEKILQKLPPHPAPLVKYEQYTTPANIAAEIIFNAYLEGDIDDKVVLDLGCGTGIFALGAKLLSALEVIGIDIDSTSLGIAERYADALSLDIKLLEMDINELDITKITSAPIDTIIQNPPFGAQKADKGADRIFLEKALKLANIVYSLHLSKTEDFVDLLVKKLGGKVVWKKKYIFPIRHIFQFHTRETVNYDVTLFKIEKNKI